MVQQQVIIGYYHINPSMFKRFFQHQKMECNIPLSKVQQQKPSFLFCRVSSFVCINKNAIYSSIRFALPVAKVQLMSVVSSRCKVRSGIQALPIEPRNMNLCIRSLFKRRQTGSPFKVLRNSTSLERSWGILLHHWLFQ